MIETQTDRRGDVNADGTPHLHFLQEPHPAGCHHEGLLPHEIAAGKLFATQEPMERPDGVAWLDVWSVTERATGQRAAVLVLRKAISDDEGYCAQEHIRPIAHLLDPREIERFDMREH